MERPEVYVWGFLPDDLALWPDDLTPRLVDTDTWPDHAPVVVHGQAWTSFQALYDAGTIEATADTVLFLPPGMEEPEEAWAYFDEVVRADDENLWGILRDLAEYPLQYQVEAWASEVPDDVLDTLHRPGQGLDYQALPLPTSVLALLRDAGYRQAFDEALQRRLQARRMVRGFSEEQLEDYVRNRMDDKTRKEVESFLETSPLARASVDVLHAEWANPTPVAPLTLAPETQTSDVDQTLARVFAGLLMIAHISTRRHSWRQRSTALPMIPEEDADLAALLKAVSTEESVLLEGTDFECEITLDAEHQALVFYDLLGSGSRLKPVFWVELRDGEQPVLSIPSQEGHATVPLAAIRKALAQGADGLVISSA